MFKVYNLEEVLKITIRHIYKHLHRFIEKGYIEKYQKIRGRYRFTDLGIRKIKEIEDTFVLISEEIKRNIVKL